MGEDEWGSNIGASYDPETDTYRARYHPDEPGSLSGAIIYLVSVATGNEPGTMPTLYEAVDTDALENLFQSREGETAEVEFQYCGCEVTAMSNGRVWVTCPENDD